MSSSARARLTVVALMIGMGLMIGAPAAAGALSVERFYSLTCNENNEEGKAGECNPGTPGEFYKQAGGHPNFGITDLKPSLLSEFGVDGIKAIRTDLPPGFATSPQALPECTREVFEENGEGEENRCAAKTQAGTEEVTIVVAKVGEEFITATFKGTIYNLVPASGLPLEFGIDLNVAGKHLHSFLEGGVSWHKEKEATEEGIESGDYHEFFKILAGAPLSKGGAPLVR
ncbi:MAG TPA: hypothetical protein VFO24_06170, partial [Usitatibacter sp.]|nr:hypothetical protein [Usitatibacter sp.]